MKTIRTIGLLAAALTALLATACGATTNSPTGAGSGGVAEPNAADVMFVQGMIPHHRHGHGNGPLGMGGMSGMMTTQQMGQLGQATGAEFDRMFLQMMTAHHTGAVQMAQTELSDGQSSDAKALAQRIIDAQRAEITDMQGLLTTP